MTKTKKTKQIIIIDLMENFKCYRKHDLFVSDSTLAHLFIISGEFGLILFFLYIMHWSCFSLGLERLHWLSL